MAKKKTAQSADLLPAFNIPAAFATLDDSMASVDDTPPPVPYLGFYTDRSRAELRDFLVDQFGSITPGQVFVRSGDDAWLVDHRPVVLLSEFRFWGAYDWGNGGQLTDASLTDRQGLSESFLIVTAHLPTSDEETPLVAVSRVLKSQAAFCRDLVNGVREAKTPKFIARVKAKNAKLASALAQLPPKFRVVGQFRNEMKTSQSSGYNYLRTACRVAPIGLSAFTALGQALQDTDFQEALQQRADVWEWRKKEVQELAG